MMRGMRFLSRKASNWACFQMGAGTDIGFSSRTENAGSRDIISGSQNFISRKLRRRAQLRQIKDMGSRILKVWASLEIMSPVG